MKTNWLLGIVMLGLLAGAPPQARATEKVAWTVLLYYVGEHGDGGLEEVQIDVARAIMNSQPSADVKVVMQSDRSKWKTSDKFYYDPDYKGIERFELESGADKPWRSRGRLATENAAHPKTLYDFMTWAAERYPADNYALLIDGHGSGVLSFNGPGSVGDPKNAGAVAYYPLRSAPTTAQVSGFGGGLFGVDAPTPGPQGDGTFLEEDGTISSFTGVGSDSDTGVEGARDDLSWPELERVFKDFEAFSGVRLGVLGLYNCYGGNLEGMYQLRDAVQFVCASPTTESFGTVDGHDPFVSELSKNPQLTPEQAARILVTNFTDDAVKNGTSEIKFAWDMRKIPAVVRSLSTLADLLRAEYARGDFGFERAALIEYSDDGYYWDIRSIAQALLDGKYSAKDHSNRAALQTAAQALKDTLYAAWPAGWATGEHRYAEPKSLKHLFVNRKKQTVGGLSIYWPDRELRGRYIGNEYRSERAFYKALDFSEDSRWDDFIDGYLEVPEGTTALASGTTL